MSAEALDKPARESRADTDERLLNDAFDDVRRYLGDAIDSIGGSEVAAGICQIDRSDLRKSIDERAGRGLWWRHIAGIGRRALRVNPSLALRLGSALVAPLDLEVFPRVTLTDKERADRLERMMRSMPLGEQLVEEALRR